ncbi:MAG TPA: AraC family transcriptional regulator [Mucilaginibacter sp.]|jgi:AraC-like DNA-binding protein
MRKLNPKIKYCPPSRDHKRLYFVDHVRIPPEEQITFHQHETLEISYIIRGSGTRIIGNTMEAFSQGEIVFIPSNIPHCWSFDSFDTYADGTIENICIFFSSLLLENACDNFPQLQDFISKIQQRQEAIVLTRITLLKVQQLMKAMPLESEIEQFSSLFRIFSLIAADDKSNIVGSRVIEDRDSKRMQKAYYFVINNFQRSISLDEASKYVGMDRSSFCTFFKKMTGKSFFTFLTEYRLESSSQMLQKTNLSVSEICSAVGFNDVPHFNRVFKKMQQITPTQFRADSLLGNTA